MKRVAGLASIAALLLLSGCSAAPTRDDIADRFLTELTDSQSIRDGMHDVGLSMADDALDGSCGSEAYEDGLEQNGDASLVYAWRVTCLMYFEGDLTAQQIATTKSMIVEHGVAG